jgi:hypothetical protein
MASFPVIASLSVYYANGCPVEGKRILIKTSASHPNTYAYGITDNQGLVDIPVFKEEGRVTIDGKTVHYGSLIGGVIEVELREACPELPD